MPFQVSCAHCGNRLNVKDEWEGKRIKCPRCGDMFPAARPAQSATAADAAAVAAMQRSRVRALADEEIPESPYGLPFRFGPDDVHPRLLYWGFMLYLLLDAIIAVPILVRLGRDPSNQCLECLIGRASAIVVPLAIGVCIFVAYSIAALMYAGWKLLFVGVVTAGAFGAHMDGQPVEVSPIVLMALWHAIGLVLGIWYFMVRRD
jgi:phage FluMu protein Com